MCLKVGAEDDFLCNGAETRERNANKEVLDDESKIEKELWTVYYCRY